MRIVFMGTPEFAVASLDALLEAGSDIVGVVTAPDKPATSIVPEDSNWSISWNHKHPDDVFRWVVYFKYGEKWSYKILNRNDNNIEVLQKISRTPTSKDKVLLTAFAVTAVDRTGNESEFIEQQIVQK